jgi:hypothetical protein
LGQSQIHTIYPPKKIEYFFDDIKFLENVFEKKEKLVKFTLKKKGALPVISQFFS